jgi:arylsulfatase A
MKKSLLSYVSLSSCLIPFQVACIQTPKEQIPAENRPNIILILADDIGFETIGSYGSSIYKTPRIDKMAGQGVRFEQCYSQPLSSPSRVQLMTGKSNFRNYERWGYLNQNETNFAHILKSKGYATCIAGKWQLKGDEYAPYKAGFDEYLLWNIMDTSSTYNERYKNPRVLENGKKKKYTNGEYGPKLFVDFITNFMERKKDAPFLVYYPMVLSHRPFVPTPDNGKAYDDFKIVKRGESGGSPSDNNYFKDEMAFLDKNVGEILDKVNELGISKNTLILFTADNGTGVGIVSTMKDGRNIPGMKGYTNEYGIHVPLIAYWDGKIKPGQVNSNLVDFTDFLPTLCDAAKIKLPESFITDGRSFLPLMLGESYTPREWLFCHYDPQKGDFPKARFVHNKEWKLYETGEIYHVVNDPLEKTVIAGKDLNPEQKKLISTFREVFPTMVKKEEVMPVKKAKIKKKSNEEEDL